MTIKQKYHYLLTEIITVAKLECGDFFVYDKDKYPLKDISLNELENMFEKLSDLFSDIFQIQYRLGKVVFNGFADEKATKVTTTSIFEPQKEQSKYANWPVFDGCKIKRDITQLNGVKKDVESLLPEQNELNNEGTSLKIDFDINKGEVFVVGNRDKAWAIRNKNGKEKENGKAALEMFKQRGKACYGNRNNVRSLIRSLSSAYNVAPSKIEKNIFCENDYFGVH